MGGVTDCSACRSTDGNHLFGCPHRNTALPRLKSVTDLNHRKDELTTLLETGGLTTYWFIQHPDGVIRERYALWRLRCNQREEANLARMSGMAVSFTGRPDVWKDAAKEAGDAEVALFAALKKWLAEG